MTSGGHGGQAWQPCLAVMFPPGSRPSAGDVRDALAHGAIAQISHDPASRHGTLAASDWLEVLLDGLTFDLLGLAPGASLLVPEPRHCLGLSALSFVGAEAIGIAPGPHLAGAANALPVFRTMIRLAATLVAQWSSAIGVSWLPAGNAVRPDLFETLANDWLGGGPFPTLALTGFEEGADGGLLSEGLAFFTGQELCLSSALCGDRVAATRITVRLIDSLIGQGPLEGEASATLDGGERLQLVAHESVIIVSPG